MSFATEEDVARLTYAERKMNLLSQIWSGITSVRHALIVGEIIKLLDIAFPQPPAEPDPAAGDNVVPLQPAAA